MKINALISTALVLGSTAIASAHPYVEEPCDDDEATTTYQRPLPQESYDDAAPVYGTSNFYPDHQQAFVPQTTGGVYRGWVGRAPNVRRPYFEESGYAHQSRLRWFDLTQPTRLDSGREVILVGADKGLFSAIALQNVAGRSRINQVTIEYLDGRGQPRLQVMRTSQVLNQYENTTLPIDLPGSYRAINRIIIDGWSGRGSAFKIRAR